MRRLALAQFAVACSAASEMLVGMIAAARLAIRTAVGAAILAARSSRIDRIVVSSRHSGMMVDEGITASRESGLHASFV